MDLLNAYNTVLQEALECQRPQVGRHLAGRVDSLERTQRRTCLGVLAEHNAFAGDEVCLAVLQVAERCHVRLSTSRQNFQ